MNKTTSMSILLAVIAVALVAACGGSETDEGQLSSSEAATVSQAAMAVTSQVEGELFSGLGDRLASREGGWISGTPESFVIEVTLENPKGGTATIVGSGGRTPRETCGGVDDKQCPDGQRCLPKGRYPDAPGECVPASEWTVTLTITFNDWVVEQGDMVLNGSLALGYEIKAMPPRSFLMTAQGQLTIGPPLPLDVDLTVMAADKQVSICGTVAGQPIDNGNCS